MTKVHRVSVVCLDNEIVGQCTCGRGKTVYAYNKPNDHLVIYRAYKVMRQLMERHWWRKHGKNKIFGSNWKSISPRVPLSSKPNAWEQYYKAKERSKPIHNSFQYISDQL